MEFYGSQAAMRLNPVVVDEDSTIGFVVSIEIGSGKRLTEGRLKARW
jgi:hypothetical protein